MTKRNIGRLSRREFIKASTFGIAVLPKFPLNFLGDSSAEGKTAVALVKTQDRVRGVKETLRLLSIPSPKGRNIFLKPNFNTSDPAPGSTHNDTLRQLILELKERGSGGHISMSLKLAVGLTPKSIRRELHSKRDTDMRRMIAELNLGYAPKVIIMDGVEVFVDGGPSRGKKVDAGVFIGGTDRVAVDAVGVAVLKELGSNETIMSKKIFEQEQIQRAVELGLGIKGPDQIEIMTPDKESKEYMEKIQSILKEG